MEQKRKKRKRRRLRKGIFAKIIMGFLGIFILSLLIFAKVNPILLDSKEPVVEYKSEYDPRSNIKNVFFHNTDEVKIEGTVNTNEIGTYTIYYVLNNKKIETKVQVKDTTAPKLQTKDFTTYTNNDNIKAKDFVKSCKDKSKVKYTILTEITNKSRQTLEIQAKDAAGNKTIEKAKLILKDDETKPEIKETKKIKVNAGTEIDYTKYIKVTDDLDPSPNIHYDDSDVDYQTPGTYTLKITATDGNKNKAKKNIKVTIKEPEKIVYLTFDDGPSENTDKVLKILKKNNAKATFFVTGNDQEHNDSIKKAYDAGHTIGLHTYTHDYSKVYSSTSAYFEDLQKISDMVKDITGEESKIIRFPGGSSNQVSAKYCQGIMTQLVDMVHEKGYEYFDWNVASTDAASVTEPTSSIIQSATSGVDNELVILFHDSYPKTTTVEALQTIIDYYKEQGYTFKALKHDSFAAHHEPQN